MISFKGRRFPKDIILMGVRWKLAYALSYRDIEEMMSERGVGIDHSNVQRWVVKYSPELEQAFCKRKKAVGSSWRLDETYIKVNGNWVYLYRAVDKQGATVDFMLSEKRDRPAVMKFFEKSIGSSGLPETITIDKSGANTAACHRLNLMLFFAGIYCCFVEIRRIKYLNNIVEQDHRFIKKVTRYTLGFKTFESAEATIAGIELHHMLKKRQMQGSNDPAWKQFYNLAA